MKKSLKDGSAFDFMTANEESKTATSGNPEELKKVEEEPIPYEELQKIARSLAESPEGLDIEAFQKKYKLQVLNVESLLGD